jgi:hypothetical protein
MSRLKKVLLTFFLNKCVAAKNVSGRESLRINQLPKKGSKFYNSRSGNLLLFLNL